MHDVVGGITIATILAATFSSNQQINSLRVEMHGIRTVLLGKLESIQKDMREFYAEQARHDVRIPNLEQQQHKN